MAVLKSIATGNFLTASTWGLVDSTSYLNSETGSDVLGTNYSDTRSSAFTPGAITVAGIGVKLSVRTGTTGTMSVNLELDSDNSQVAGTEVTIDTADLPVAATADLNGGWVYFEFATPVLLLAATAYQVAAKTSSATQVSLFRDGTTDNISRILVTTTTQAPAVGDDLIVAGEYIDASTFNSFTVTMNETATTDYGAAATSLVTPALAICNGGTLTWGTTAATNYSLKLSGNLIIYSGGTMNMGTTGTPCPRDSSMTLTFDCGANVDFGLTVRNLGTLNAQGLSRTSGKNIVSCKLNTDEAAGQTTLGVDTDTGWLNGDEIAIASTTRTASECESRTLNANANASDMTVSSGLTNAHSGTSPTQAEVILLTRNVKIFGASASLQAYVVFESTSTVDIDWVEFKWLGSAASPKNGVRVNTTTGSLNIQYSSLHNFEVTISYGLAIVGSSVSNITFSNNVTYLIANNHFIINNATTGTWTADSNIFMRNTDSANLVTLSDIGGTFTNNTMVGAGSGGVLFSETGAFTGTFTGNTVHSCASTGISLSGLWGTTGTFTTMTIWRCNSTGISISSASDIIIDTLTVFGNTTRNIIIASSGNIVFYTVTSNGDTTFSTTNGVEIGNTILHDIKFYSSDFSSVTGIKTAHTNDFNLNSTSTQNSGYTIVLNSVKLGASTEVANQTLIGKKSFISSQKHDQTAGLHKTWKKYGTITIETTTTQTGTTSFKMTPNNASNKLESGSFYIAVANGATLTPSVYVYEDASYNGARARLILKRNDAIGITSDTVIDTATASSDEVWEALTGTTAAATDDGVMEFVVDCDGTAGNLFVDTFTVT